MALDGFFLKKLLEELNLELQNGKINKINNISNNDIILTIRNRTNKKLIISTHPQNFRLHITEKNYENPYKPSNFCTVLRKYILNGTISEFKQINNDRISFIKIKNKDELGYPKEYTLIIELMGKHSNIILTDGNMKILEALKNEYSIEFSRYTISNSTYTLPPTEKKINPFEIENYKLPNEHKDLKYFSKNFYGFSLLLNNYLINNNILLNNFIDELAKQDTPILFIFDNNKRDFYFFDIYKEYLKKIEFNSYSNLLDFYYADYHLVNINKEKNKFLYDFIKNKLNRLTKKLITLNNEIEEIKKDDGNLIKGQLLIANNYLFKKNIPEKVSLQNFYSEKLEFIEIPLNTNISIEQNAENYFNKNKKNKRTIVNLEEQIKITKNEIDYFDNVKIQIENADISDIDEIISELEKYKYIKSKKSIKIKKNNYHTITHNNQTIYIGKNNTQNDNITNKLAKKDYLWFHIKDMPGSHVVIFNNNPEYETILLAATLAAYYSKAKNEKYALVDYTQIKYVKKIPNSKLGMVSYTNNKTIKVNIDKMLISKYIK